MVFEVKSRWGWRVVSIVAALCHDMDHSLSLEIKKIDAIVTMDRKLPTSEKEFEKGEGRGTLVQRELVKLSWGRQGRRLGGLG